MEELLLILVDPDDARRRAMRSQAWSAGYRTIEEMDPVGVSERLAPRANKPVPSVVVLNMRQHGSGHLLPRLIQAGVRVVVVGAADGERSGNAVLRKGAQSYICFSAQGWQSVFRAAVLAAATVADPVEPVEPVVAPVAQ